MLLFLRAASEILVFEAPAFTGHSPAVPADSTFVWKLSSCIISTIQLLSPMHGFSTANGEFLHFSKISLEREENDASDWWDGGNDATFKKNF